MTILRSRSMQDCNFQGNVLSLSLDRCYQSRSMQDCNFQGNVLSLSLDIKKPSGFKNKSGMYLFVKRPNISPFEWYPFFITSAPGDDYMSMIFVHSGHMNSGSCILIALVAHRCKITRNATFFAYRSWDWLHSFHQHTQRYLELFKVQRCKFL